MVSQIRAHVEKEVKALRILSFIHTNISESIFMRIMTCETVKEEWDALKELYQGNDKTRRIHVLNPKRDFEILPMKKRRLYKSFSKD